MSKPLNLHDGTGVIAKSPTKGILIAFGSTVPADGTIGYAPGCHFIKTNGTTIDTLSFTNVGTKASAQFIPSGASGAIQATCLYGEASAIDSAFFVAEQAYQVQSIIARPLVAGTDAGAVTAQIRKAGDGVAPASGTVLHTGTINLKGTINTNQTATLSATPADLELAAGDALAFDVTGTTTAARGIVTVKLLPV